MSGATANEVQLILDGLGAVREEISNVRAEIQGARKELRGDLAHQDERIVLLEQFRWKMIGIAVACGAVFQLGFQLLAR